MAKAIQKILPESELNDTIAPQEATNRTNSFGETERQRMLSTSGPYLQQIKANSCVPNEIKGHDDKINYPIVLTTTPSQAADSNERTTSTGARTSLSFPSRLDVNTPALVPQNTDQSAARTDSE